MMEEVIEDSNGESGFEFVGGTIKDSVSDVSSCSAAKPQTPFQFFASDSDTVSRLADTTSHLKLDGGASPPLNVPPPAALPVFDVEPQINALNKNSEQPSGQIQSYFSSSNVPFPLSNTFSPVDTSFTMQPSSARPIMSAVANESVTQLKPASPPPLQFPLQAANSANKPPPSTGVQPSSLPPPPIQQSSDIVTGQRDLPPVAYFSPPVVPSGIPSIQSHFITPPAVDGLPESSSTFSQSSNIYYQPQIIQASSTTPNVLSTSSHSTTASYNFSESYVSPSNLHQEVSAGSDFGKGLFSWIKDSVTGNELLSKFAEKAKSSVDSVIYTLDPQMKDFMNACEEITIVVASDKEVKVGPVRQSFKSVFVQASVGGISSHANIAEQPVGYTSALKGAEERIFNLRQRGIVYPNQPVVAIESFLLEAMPDNWFEIGCLLLQDPKRGLTLKTFTQATPVPTHFVLQAQDCTPDDYPLRWSGFAIPIGQIIGSAMNVPHNEWHDALVGVSRQEMFLLAAKVLAGQYKVQINTGIAPQTMTL